MLGLSRKLPHSNIKLWNPSAERIFGWTETEVLEQPNSIISIELEEYQKIKTSILQGITPSSLELRQAKKDGTLIDIVFSAAPLRNSDGVIDGMVVVVADISEQKRQAEQVRLLQSVVVNTNDAILITESESIDESGPRILYMNQAFTRMTGYTPEEVLGKTPRILQGPKTDPVALERIRNALLSWETVTVEMINYRQDGSEFWVEFNLVPVADQKGYYTHWIAVQRDITERKRIEEALRRSEEKFRSLIENTLDIITILDSEGTIQYISPSVEKVLGYKSASLINQNFFTPIHPDDFVDTCYHITNAIKNPEVTVTVEFRYHHQDGSWRTLEAISQRFIDDAEGTQIFVNSRDISERKRLEEVRLALEKEKELSAMKIRFFSMASHEFRTPLSTALAAAQLLENSPFAWEDHQKRTRNLHRIQDAIKHMVQLLNDILTINRAETGNLEFNPRCLDLEKFCRQFLEEIRLSDDSQHILNFLCEGNQKHAYLDEKLLRSIIGNLLSNAIKYSPENTQVDFLLNFVADEVVIQICDQGIGIPINDKKQLF
ncbi:MAG: PAS domain S-box protein, partial [Sphaerospermopsis kisseleviana]